MSALANLKLSFLHGAFGKSKRVSESTAGKVNANSVATYTADLTNVLNRTDECTQLGTARTHIFLLFWALPRPIRPEIFSASVCVGIFGSDHVGFFNSVPLFSFFEFAPLITQLLLQRLIPLHELAATSRCNSPCFHQCFCLHACLPFTIFFICQVKHAVQAALQCFAVRIAMSRAALASVSAAPSRACSAACIAPASASSAFC